MSGAQEQEAAVVPVQAAIRGRQIRLRLARELKAKEEAKREAEREKEREAARLRERERKVWIALFFCLAMGGGLG